jgi:hypothetical protein
MKLRLSEQAAAADGRTAALRISVVRSQVGGISAPAAEPQGVGPCRASESHVQQTHAERTRA